MSIDQDDINNALKIIEKFHSNIAMNKDKLQ